MKGNIKDLYDDGKSVCGELLNNEFYFKTIEDAVSNGMNAHWLSGLL